ncbi:MAG: Rne/Rng family ribonuclease [Acidobacteriota bacterium]
MRRMLINARHPDELRVAVLAEGQLENFQVEVAEKGLERGNIYRGTIANIQPSLNAAFIDYGAERHGFLAIQDVVPEAYYHEPGKKGRPRIEEVLERGQPIVVQVQKEAGGQKGAALTTNLSIAGRYLVLTPFDDTRGVSRKVEDDAVRRKLRAQAKELEVPAGCGVIMRTNALEQNKTALHRDSQALLRLWTAVRTQAVSGKGIRLLYSDQDLLVRALRDHLDTEVDEILVDDAEAFAKAQQYMRAFMPRSKTRLLLYEDRAPLFALYDVESQIERIYERTAALPSGGSIVIDRTEALTAIDVNSGKATRAASQEETAVQTNVEAAREVARQLRLRDLGGLVVVDFIDMRASKNQRRVEKELREALKADRARSTVGRISPNGLLEINRQRIQQALDLRTHDPCPTCGGTGRVMSAEQLSLSLLRRIEARATAVPIERVRLSVHPELASVLNEQRRREIDEIQTAFDLKLEIVPSRRLRPTEHEFEWFDRAGAARRPAPVFTSTAGEPAAAAPLPAPAAKGAAPGSPPAGGGRSRRRRGGRGRRKRGRDRQPAGRAAEGGKQPGTAPSAGETAAAPPPSEAPPQPPS